MVSDGMKRYDECQTNLKLATCADLIIADFNAHIREVVVIIKPCFKEGSD
jgi:hypothetical protein